MNVLKLIFGKTIKIKYVETWDNTTIVYHNYILYHIRDKLEKLYELRLPKYNLNDTFPIVDGYTKITYSLNLKRGRYYSGAPILLECKDFILDAKKKHDLRLVIKCDVFSAAITAKNLDNFIMKNAIIEGKEK